MDIEKLKQSSKVNSQKTNTKGHHTAALRKETGSGKERN